MDIKAHIRGIPDFPKPGIYFYDISTLLANADAWQVALNANYGRWQVTRSVDEGFAASILNRDFSGVRVVECVCDPCTGRRLPQFVEQEPEPYVGVQITKAGRERFHLGGEDISLGAGDLVIWTSTRPAEFTVVERLHKVSLVLP